MPGRWLVRESYSKWIVLGFAFGLLACGAVPNRERVCNGVPTDLDSDAGNCGACGTTCPGQFSCIGGVCLAGQCEPGATEQCYTGQIDTLGVGPCSGGTRTCQSNGAWTSCVGEIVPAAENCS